MAEEQCSCKQVLVTSSNDETNEGFKDLLGEFSLHTSSDDKNPTYWKDNGVYLKLLPNLQRLPTIPYGVRYWRVS